MYFQLTKLAKHIEKFQIRMMMKHGLHAYQPDPFGVCSGICVDRDISGTTEKWELISQHLPDNPFSALDIGCNIGFFSFKLAQKSKAYVVGMEAESGPILIAEKLKIVSKVDNVGFCKMTINENNVDTLGTYDVVLFLSVFHHLVYAYDMDTAMLILSCIIRKTRKVLFFESGQGDQGYGKMASSMPDIARSEAPDFFTKLLSECGAKESVVIGETILNQKKNVKRLLFKVIPPD